MRKYNQLIYGVDRAIAMIREELDAQGVAGNTVIILTSDNGYNCGAHGFSGKVLPYEEGSRAPLLIFDPRHKSAGKGYRCEGVTGNIDMMPTILDYAGLAVPGADEIDGKSLRPMMDNPKGNVRDTMAIMNVWGSIPTHEMSIVSEDHKYLNWFFAGEGFEAAEELYDLKNDRYEMKNLINDPSKKSVLEKLRKAYDKQIEHWKRTCVQTSGYPEWAIFLDRNVSWEEKEKLIPEKEFRKYRESLRD
jgi:arylsulfatase A-like enzyme